MHAVAMRLLKGGKDSKKPIDGVKRPSMLLTLLRFNIILGFVPDYMHAVDLGIGKYFANMWISHRGKPYSLPPHTVDKIDQLMSKIKVPNQLYRLSRSFQYRKWWTAREWENWILYYSIPVLSAFPEFKQYLEHWTLLVSALYLLLQKEVTRAEVQLADSLSSEFVEKTEILYDGSNHLSQSFINLTHADAALQMVVDHRLEEMEIFTDDESGEDIDHDSDRESDGSKDDEIPSKRSNECSTALNEVTKYHDYVVKERISDPRRIKDIYDSQLYMGFVEQLPLDYRHSFATAAFNVDGIAVFECSDYSIWVIYIMINEIPPQARLKSPMIVGLWIGKEKPAMQVFLDKFVEFHNELTERGIECVIKGETRMIRLYLLIAPVDTIARFVMNATVQFSSEFGCDWCFQKGVQYLGSNRYPYEANASMERDEAKHVV
ncbi:hypothetical protein QAD02_007452 [Eretmocerus hayati]|uniref:Uncharacterized protein n=1 Tax=Eretmocerus hayati TaxID=131215 RepID=A0ACC2N807_9HYME|nr:hypothetical protein QAD02_007452 [Eretmocerus hayati]